MAYKAPFLSYREMCDYVREGRDPRRSGRKYTSAFRLYLRDGHIEIFNHKTRLALLHSDNILEFVATTRTFWSCGSSLAQNLTKLVPVDAVNFTTGRYKIVPTKLYDGLPGYKFYTTQDYTTRHAAWLKIRRDAQEYFQYLKLDLKTGEIINPKKLVPETNVDKRKEWLAGVKSFRLRLRAMARVGALEGHITALENTRTGYFTKEEVSQIAEAIMTGEVSVETARLLCKGTGTWKLRNTENKNEVIYETFENLIKSASRDMRLHLGVITLKD
jgi:hypothetical protein